MDFNSIQIGKFLATLLMVNSGWFTDDYPLWFFSVLLLFYLLYFAVAKFAKGAVYPVLLLIMIFGGRVILLQEPQAPFLYRWNGEGMFNFFLDALIQIINYRLEKKKQRLLPEYFWPYYSFLLSSITDWESKCGEI